MHGVAVLSIASSGSVMQSPEHRKLLRLHPIAALTLGGFQCDQRRDGLIFIREPIHPHLTALPYAAPFAVQRPFAEQVRHDRHPVEPGDVLRRLALFEICLHCSEMILARDFQGFCLFGADVFLGALNTGMAEQQLGRAQVAGLLVNMGREGPAQRMQAIEAGIEVRFVQPGLEQPPELAFAEVGVGPPCPLPRE